MSEEQDAQNMDALVNAYNDITFEGTENPRGVLNDLFRKESDNHSIEVTDNIRDDFAKVYGQYKVALRLSILNMITYYNGKLNNKIEKEPSQKLEIETKIQNNKKIFETLKALW